MKKAVDLAVYLVAESQGELQMAAQTKTIRLEDDYEPKDDSLAPPLVQVRHTSAIEIAISKPKLTKKPLKPSPDIVLVLDE